MRVKAIIFNAHTKTIEMKKLLAMLAIAGAMVACNDEASTENPTPDSTSTPSTVSPADTSTSLDTTARPADTVIKK